MTASEDMHELADSSTVSSAHATSPGLRGFHKRRQDDPPPVRGSVPPRNPNFTRGRELLEQLGKRLTARGTTAVLPAALHGMGGIGKAQMATEYIYRHSQDYDLIWRIEDDRPTQIRAGLTERAKQLGLSGASEANTAVREAMRLGWPFRRWLPNRVPRGCQSAERRCRNAFDARGRSREER